MLLKRKDTLASRLPLTSQTRRTGEVSELKSLTTSPCSSSSNWSEAEPTTTRNHVAIYQYGKQQSLIWLSPLVGLGNFTKGKALTKVVMH